jgi:GAF domain-containing protein
MDDKPLGQAVLSVHRFICGSSTFDETLNEVIDAATDQLGADMAGLTIRDELGRPTTIVYTDRMVPEIDQVQYDNDRGPCLDAARHREVFRIDQTEQEQRWPEFGAAAARHGLHSTLSMPVLVAERGIGALNFYDHRTGYFNDGHISTGELFTGQCAIAAAYLVQANLAENLSVAMTSRGVIEQAKGIIMGTTGVSADAAFDLLRQQSQQENRKLRDVAQELVDRHRNSPG